MIVLFNKPYGVLCQFTDHESRSTLADYVDIPGIYPAGRLDRDSEGLLVLTDDGKLQNRIASPAHKLPKIYWVQVEGEITDEALGQLRHGIELKDGRTLPAGAERMEQPATLWPRVPPIRVRKQVPTSWLRLELREGKNRQVRRMTAATGFPTLRLVRAAVGDWQLGELGIGEYVTVESGKARGTRANR